MNRIVIILVLLSGGGAFALWKAGVFSGDDKTVESQATSTRSRRGTLSITLTERGTLKAKKSTQIRAATHGKISWMAEEGAKVKKDDVLVKMDTQQLQQMIDTLQNQITQGEADFKSAETEVTVQEGQNMTNIEKAELNVEVKNVEIEKFNKSDHPAKVRDLEIAIKDAETQLSRAKENVRNSSRLLKEDFVTENDHEDTLLKLDKAESNLQGAQMKKTAYFKYEYPLQLKQKNAAVTEAERGEIRAKQRADAQLNSKRARVLQRKVNLLRTKQRHKRESEKLAKMTLKAPTDGTILIGDPGQPVEQQPDQGRRPGLAEHGPDDAPRFARVVRCDPGARGRHRQAQEGHEGLREVRNPQGQGVRRRDH